MFAQDEGGEGLVGYADVQVNLKDINDNAPIFPQGVYFGNVTENGTAGLWGVLDEFSIRNAGSILSTIIITITTIALPYRYICAVRSLMMSNIKSIDFESL